jgi:hypothetical protein
MEDEQKFKFQVEDRERQKRIEAKLDKILELLEEKVTKNCEKMSEHIDFIDNVYDNVKNPLGFICNKVGSMIGSSENYALADKNEVD